MLAPCEVLGEAEYAARARRAGGGAMDDVFLCRQRFTASSGRGCLPPLPSQLRVAACARLLSRGCESTHPSKSACCVPGLDALSLLRMPLCLSDRRASTRTHVRVLTSSVM